MTKLRGDYGYIDTLLYPELPSDIGNVIPYKTMK